MPPTDQARWFSEQVLPCEPALRAYLRKRFPALSDYEDLVQEVYVRLKGNWILRGWGRVGVNRIRQCEPR